MLNISENSISHSINISKYKSFDKFIAANSAKVLTFWLFLFFVLFIVVLFLPWTQNIQSNGVLTALSPQDRPQTINTIIPGRIEKWYVQEGQSVRKGDTIVFLSEIKDTYFDPNLLRRVETQIEAKESYRDAYEKKTLALDGQISSLEQAMKLKMSQAENKITQVEFKITTDSMEYNAAKNNYDIAVAQYNRQKELFEQGLKSTTELEQRELKVQEAQAKLTSTQNKLLTSRSELLNAKIEFNNLTNEYGEKLSKSESDRYSAVSSIFEADAELMKMRGQFMNYSVRAGLYYVTAPRDGIITKALKTGIGETIKEGEQLVSIIPEYFNRAVELYVKPMDLPLISIGQKVMLRFDGWPALVFSGWPGSSFGTFPGRVTAIDNFISENGKYRLLISPEEKGKAWPADLHVGTGANGIAMLKDVPIWYEIWRQLNAFPPDYYKEEVPKKIGEKEKPKIGFSTEKPEMKEGLPKPNIKK